MSQEYFHISKTGVPVAPARERPAETGSLEPLLSFFPRRSREMGSAAAAAAAAAPEYESFDAGLFNDSEAPDSRSAGGRSSLMDSHALTPLPYNTHIRQNSHESFDYDARSQGEWNGSTMLHQVRSTGVDQHFYSNPPARMIARRNVVLGSAVPVTAHYYDAQGVPHTAAPVKYYYDPTMSHARQGVVYYQVDEDSVPSNTRKYREKPRNEPGRLSAAANDYSIEPDWAARSEPSTTGREAAPAIKPSKKKSKRGGEDDDDDESGSADDMYAEPGRIYTPDQQSKWDEMYQRLVKFKEKHCHTRVPEGYEDAKLANWVGNQRRAMSRQQRGLPARRFDKRRIHLLEAIGFEWARKRANKPGLYDKRSWEEMFQSLIQFKETYGHTRVPPSFDNRLANWVSNQRTAMSRKKRGLPYRCLNKQRIEELNSIGFVWVASKNGHHDNESKDGTAEE
jgi:hypothetical protein